MRAECHTVKSLQLLRSSGSRKWHLRVPGIRMVCSDSVFTPVGRLSIKMSSYQYMDLQVKDRLIFNSVIPYLGKMVFILWRGPAYASQLWPQGWHTILEKAEIVLCTLALRGRHNGCDSVSNHQPHHCLLNRLFRRRSKKTSKLRVTGLCAVNSPGTGEFSAQMASNAEKVSIWWRHHGIVLSTQHIVVSSTKIIQHLLSTCSIHSL